MKKQLISILLLVSICSQAQIGIGTTAPNSTLDVRGSFSTKYTSFSGNTTAGASDNMLVFTGTSATTLTLPDATACQGRVYWIKNTSSNSSTLTIATTSSQTVDGLSTWPLTQTNKAARLVSNGSNWLVVSESLPGNSSGTSWIHGGNNVSSIQNIGTTSNYDLPFITNNSERMRLTNSGNFGLGTTSPSEKLDVTGNIRIGGGNKRLVFAGMTGDPDAAIELHLTAVNEQQEMLFYVGNDVNSGWGPDRIRMIGEEFKFQSFNAAFNSTLANAESETNLYTRMYISPTGNVAIGSTSFDNTNPEKLLVDAGDNPSSFNLIAARGTKDDYLQLNIQNRSNGNSASSDIVSSADNATEIVNYIDMGINSSSYSNTGTNILNGINRAYLYSTGREFYIGNGGNNYPLVFFTNNSGTTGTNGTERMRINAAGDVCIGTTTQNGANKLTVNGSISASAFNVSSDRRLKTNIRPAYYGLRHIMALQPVSWNWRDNVQDQTQQLGFIAQDVKQLIPEIVSGNEQTGTLSINYTELIPVLVNAIKEQQQEIDQLKKKVEALKRRR